MQRSASYFRTPQLGGATPQETEILAFGFCNDRLGRANTPRQRIQALHLTHQLWSLLVRDVGAPANALPDDLKRQIVALGFWAMAYSTRALSSDLALNPLIEVHQNLIDGLRAQTRRLVEPPELQKLDSQLCA
ncbi:flagellar biosynthesis regulator FlaF [Telmatospirillum sp.]|uniref:flagellar biosynthesis regulator FlaF n=1 Tax=Telmatospirillum sp. TaxID=2079197 RepID=UPI002840A1CF|nr:flagellar biosynthesis regulator FlaF [Telmatospirillum sp.]MDR3440138.1 flagellar biosynthesis regulator FlaF [Telmatospirillum sp.]